MRKIITNDYLLFFSPTVLAIILFFTITSITNILAYVSLGVMCFKAGEYLYDKYGENV